MIGRIKNSAFCFALQASIFTLCAQCTKTTEQYSVKDLSSKSFVAPTFLSKCPEKPNCVVSQIDGSLGKIPKKNFVLPLARLGSLLDDKMIIKEILSKMDRVELVNESDNYLHFTFTSRVFKFVDDVEFLFSEESEEIQVRSASRVGYSDLGVNRKRIENIRSLLNQQKAAHS